MQSQKRYPLGILGGGQLSRMLILDARKMGVPVLLFSKSEKDSASKVCEHRESSLTKFLQKVETVIFESEFTDLEELKKLAPKSVHFFPSLQSMKIFQDKWQQKVILKKNKISTPEFLKLDLDQDPLQQIEDLFSSYSSGVVLKWSRFGYDGKGVLLLKSKKEFLNKKKFIHQFLGEATRKNSEVYAEKMIRYTKEMAMTYVVDQKGKVSFYPLVESIQKEGICKYVFGPSHELFSALNLEKEAQKIGKKIAQKTELQGVFAIEFFLDQKKKLYVNEIAPRVHNSSHYTQDACMVSQFENHIRVALGQNAGSTKNHSLFFMLNLLSQNPEMKKTWPSIAVLHDYEKEGFRKNRKVGHVNFIFSKKSDLKKIQKIAKNLDKKLWE